MMYAPKTPKSHFHWTPQKTDMLKYLWSCQCVDEAGLYPKYSASQIAGMLGGPTRCAVLGKVRRMGLARRK
jgi:hypothetical protein